MHVPYFFYKKKIIYTFSIKSQLIKIHFKYIFSVVITKISNFCIYCNLRLDININNYTINTH